MFSFSLLITFCILKCLICEKIEQKEEKVGQLELPNKIVKNLEKSTYSLVNSTGLRHYAHYYLKDRYGYFIRWDGRKYPDGYRYGLISDTSIDFENEDWYLFTLKPFENDVYLENVKTKFYLTHDWASKFWLMNYYNSSGYPIRMRLRSLSTGYLSIQSAYYDYQYYLSYLNTYDDTYSINYLQAISSPSASYIAHLKFIPLTNLTVKISSFSYNIPNENTIKNNSTKLYLISPTIIENNNPTNLIHEIDVKKSITERLSWRFTQNLDFFRNISIIGGVPSLIGKNGGFEEIKQNFELKSTKTKGNQDFVYNREYSIKKTLEILPNNVARFESFVNQVDNLGLTFTALAVISGKDEGGQLSGSQIYSIINSISSYTVITISSFSVTVRLSGTLNAYFGLNNQFNISNTSALIQN